MIASPVEALRASSKLPLDQLVVTASQSTDAQYQSRHGFRLGSIGLLLPERTSSEIVEPLNVCQLPGSPDYLVGVINVRGALVAVFDLAVALSLDVGNRGNPHYLAIGLGGDSVAILLDQVPQRVRIDAGCRLETMPTLNRSLQAAVIEAYEVDEFLWVEWDVERLFLALQPQ